LEFDISKRLLVSTVAEDAAETAREFGLGVEVAEFCTAMNMDTDFVLWDAKARAALGSAELRVFHAPFNELCPAAIDPLVLKVARLRYEQAYKLAQAYGSSRIVVHTGYMPLVYFKEYFIERSVAFWCEFIKDKPDDFRVYLENVLEDSPDIQLAVAKRIDDPRLRLCLDIGHANTIVSELPLTEWIRTLAPYIGHVHLHNNYREWDHHNALGDGLIDINSVLRTLIQAVPTDTTFTIESIESRPSSQWLRENGFLPPEGIVL
jgi:sugar phosphate isomerase/epimerase